MQGKRGGAMWVFLGGALALLLVFGVGTSSALAVPPQIARTTVSAVGSTTAVFEAEINPQKNSTNICKGTFRATVLLDAQNGRTHDTMPALKAQCKGKGKGKGAKKAKGGGGH
jgi:hypothetical protein